MKQIILMGHVFFGVLCILSTVWLFVDVLNAREENLGRIRWMSRFVSLLMWLAFGIGGYWYVVHYKLDKAVILKGPWPFSHNFFMESKEHFVIPLLLLATYLPMTVSRNLAFDKDARRLTLWIAALVALLALFAEGNGAMIAMGVKVALQAQPH
ncbi:MAG TPA: hypothetical protein VFB72_16765 [Verrucomicrobiae bacterium]|nr:hypothetical protein [Verrucomicrobiae bacterium]